MSYGLVPSKSTVYVSNLPFDLKNNDLHKLFEKYGRIIKVTVLKDKISRLSKGVAFILFFKRDDALKCVEAINMKEMYGRTLKASIAKDNGRTSEFIRRKDYPDKTKCYECGDEGHLSYNCSKNILGDRDPPPKKVRKKKRKPDAGASKNKTVKKPKLNSEDDGNQSEDEVEEEEESLSAAIALEQEKNDLEKYRMKVVTGNYDEGDEAEGSLSKKRIRKSSYFSDEEEVE